MKFDDIQDAIHSKPKHPIEVAIDKGIERMKNDPKEAARCIRRHIYALSRKRDSYTYLPAHEIMIEALKMGAEALERTAVDDEESFYPKVLRLLDDATIAQLDSFAEYAKQRAVIKRTEEFQRDLERWRKEKEKEDGGYQ